MNFQLHPPLAPLRVLMVNPLLQASRLVTFRIMNGEVFGVIQPIDLILLVYENEIPIAEGFKIELEACAFYRTHSIVVTSTLPSISDADVFCFITNLPNPNYLDFTGPETDEQFDTLYLLLKIANNFSMNPPAPENPEEETFIKKRKKKKEESRLKKPFFLADGLVVLDILMSFSKIIPSDVLFCPTCVPSVARSVIGEFFKVTTSEINHVYVWAANDEILHVEVDRPIIKNDPVDLRERCFYDTYIGNPMREKLGIDHIQFNASWLKKDFMEKVVSLSSVNPYGFLYKTAEFLQNLRAIWRARTGDKTFRYNFGVISDGSLGTIKGLPCVLPLFFSGDTWTVDDSFLRSTFLQYEIKRINNTVKEKHRKMMIHCKKFLIENVTNKSFIPDDASRLGDESTHETSFGFTTTEGSSSQNI